MKILVAMDDSPFAQNALEKAVEMARTAGSCELFILSVVPQLGAYDEVIPRLMERLKKDARKVVTAAAERAARADIRAQTVIEEGISPADNIVGFAGDHAIDLIVVGHRGKANLEKFLLGSVAMHTISHAPCSVLVVK